MSGVSFTSKSIYSSRQPIASPGFALTTSIHDRHTEQLSRASLRYRAKQMHCALWTVRGSLQKERGTPIRLRKNRTPPSNTSQQRRPHLKRVPRTVHATNFIGNVPTPRSKTGCNNSRPAKCRTNHRFTVYITTRPTFGSSETASFTTNRGAAMSAMSVLGTKLM